MPLHYRQQGAPLTGCSAGRLSSQRRHLPGSHEAVRQTTRSPRRSWSAIARSGAGDRSRTCRSGAVADRRTVAQYRVGSVSAARRVSDEFNPEAVAVLHARPTTVRPAGTRMSVAEEQVPPMSAAASVILSTLGRSGSPSRPACRRVDSRASGSAIGTNMEVYLPDYVAVSFTDGNVKLMSRVSSGNGEEWCAEILIDLDDGGQRDLRNRHHFGRVPESDAVRPRS